MYKPDKRQPGRRSSRGKPMSQMSSKVQRKLVLREHATGCEEGVPLKKCEDKFAATGVKTKFTTEKALFEGSQTPAKVASEGFVWPDGDSASRKSWTSKDCNGNTIPATGDQRDSRGRHSTSEDVEAMPAVDSLSSEDLTVANREHMGTYVLSVADSVKEGTAVLSAVDSNEEEKLVLAVADSCKEGTAVKSAVDSCEEGKSMLSVTDSCEEETPVLSVADSCKEGTAMESAVDSCEEEKSVLSVTDSCKEGTVVESVASSCWQVPVLSCNQLPPTSSCIANGQLPHQFQLKSGGLMAIPPYYPRPKKGTDNIARLSLP